MIRPWAKSGPDRMEIAVEQDKKGSAFEAKRRRRERELTVRKEAAISELEAIMAQARPPLSNKAQRLLTMFAVQK